LSHVSELIDPENNNNPIQLIMKTLLKYALSLCSLALGGTVGGNTPAVAAEHTLDISVSAPGAEIPATMYGIFFEDINYAADGGLYAEMIKNRSFEFPQAFMGWRTFGGVTLRDDGPFERNPHYVRLSYAGHSDKHTGLENEGFFGISTRKGETYHFSVWARVPEGAEQDTSVLLVQLVDPASQGERQDFAAAEIKVAGKEWKKYRVDLKPSRTMDKAVLRLFLRRNGRKGIVTTDVEHLSLFPADTWQGRENGMRRDLAQALADLHPGVFRFPGGCIVEGTDLNSRYQWKNSVGPVENRPLNENRWHYTFDYRFYPDYYQSYGLGFFEFFQLCEDFGCEALPVVSCGLACQYQNNSAQAHVPVDELEPYIQDALDLVEFANGDVNTTWGRVRSEMGHPEPFNLKYLGVGNEQWDDKDDPKYTARLERFVTALRKAYPKLKIIGTTGPASDGWKFDLLQPKMKELGVDLYDEHYYRPESWFLANADRYDRYDRTGPKVFAGEYACHGKGKKWNHFETSLLEAAFMTGLERNADVVQMATYAPLFAHVEGWQWRPDMIWYDNSRSVKTVSYYVQQLYSQYKGSRVLPLTMGGAAVSGQEGQDGLFASAVVDQQRNALIVKVVNTGATEQPLQLRWNGKKRDCTFSHAELISLHAGDPDSENTLDRPDLIQPVTTTLTLGSWDAEGYTTAIPAQTFQIYVFTK
jgi:alpha-L-arabinofuranosidase